MLLTTTFAYLSAFLAMPVTARSIFAPSTIPGEENKVPGESPLYFCEGSHVDDVIQIYKIDLEPNPPKPGHPLAITATGTVLKNIEEGAYALVTVKLGLIKLISRTVDLCDQIGEIDMKCPVASGNVTITKTVDMPKEIPPAKFNVHADVYTADDEAITCLTGTVDFMPKRHFASYENNEDL